MTQDRTSWQIKHGDALSELIALMELGAGEAELLGPLEPRARAVAPDFAKAFYGRLTAHAHTAEFLAGSSMASLHGTVSDWFSELFCGRYDDGYARRRLRIGEIHVKIGLPVRYPLAMIDLVLPYGEAVARTSPQPEAAVTAFRKVLALDVAVFNQSYEDEQLRHLAELVGGERLARRLLTGA
jgi:hypothetical protein